MSTFKEASAETRSAPSSGRSSQTSTVLTPLELTTETRISSLKESTYTSTKLLEEDTCQEPFSWTSSQERWTPLGLDPSDNYSDQTTLSLASLEQETTGPRATTQKEQNSSTQSSMLSEKKLKDVIASKASKSLTPSAEEQDPEWEHCSSPRLEKNIQTESWRPFRCCPRPRCQTQLSSPTMRLFLSIN